MQGPCVHGLHEFVQAKGLLNTDNVDKLAGGKLGIDGLRWLLSLPIKEPYQVAMGGMYLSLKAVVSKALADFKAANIVPVFVFSGLQLARRDKSIPRLDSNNFTQACERGWRAERQGNHDEAKQSFLSQSSFTTEHINRIMQILQQFGAETFRAPFLAQPQLVWMLQHKLITGIYGSNLMLLWGVSRLITSIDLPQGTYEWLDLEPLLQSLNGMPQELFVDLCLVAGCQQPFPFGLLPRQEPFEAVAQLFLQCGSFRALVAHLSAIGQARDPQTTHFIHARAQTCVRNHLVLGVKGQCMPFSMIDCPPTLSEIFGSRLPAEVFFLLSQGVVSPMVINNVLSGFVLETAPLADSESYRTVVEKLLDTQRGPAITTLRSCLNRNFQARPLLVGKWHSEPKELVLARPITPPDLPFLRFQFSKEDMRNQLGKHSKEVDPFFCLHWVQDNSEANSGVMQPCEPGNLKHLSGSDCGDQIACYITLSVLCVHSFVAVDHAIAPPVPRLVLTHAGHASLQFSPRFTAEGMRVISLVIMGEIHGQPLDSSDPDTRVEVRFISRVLAILPMRFNGKPWDTRVDPDLIRFNSIVNRMRLEWTNLAEMMLLHIACQRPAGLHFGEYRDIIRQIRGPGEQSCALGIVAKYILTNDPTPEVNKNSLQSLFAACENPIADLTDACTFWDEVMNALNCLLRVAEKSVLFEELQQANDFLNLRRSKWGF